ncbi:MAG: DUF6178 family protein [Desulfobacterales bacterium]|jgi:hypothetical protein
MTHKKDNSKTLQGVLQLQEKRRKIMELPVEKALDRILDDPQPAALVHSFPEQDFYLLVNEIGPEDSLPLLSLATHNQWGHIVDLEVWQKDRIELNSVARWMNLLLEADPKRFIQWVLESQLEFVEFFLFKNLEVKIRGHDQDPAEFGDEYFTLDDVYYLKFTDIPTETESAKLTDEQRRAFLTKFAQQLAAYDYSTYQRVLLEMTHVIPSETEEDCYRWRSVRLAEKGFLPFDEAIGIYQRLRPEDLEKKKPKFIPRSTEEISSLPVPISPLRELKEDNHFTRALQKIAPANILQQLQAEFASLCNQIGVADHQTIGERDVLKRIVKKASAYISIGLEQMQKDKEVDPALSAASIVRYPLQDIFRVGFGSALKLKWRAEKWLSRCWFARAGLRLAFWGEKWMGVVGGLLVKKPLFYDNYKTGFLYRDFASVDDINETEAVFNQVVAVDDLLSLMNINIEWSAKYGFLTYKNLLLTLWVRQYCKLKERKLKSLRLKQFLPFFEKLLPERAEPDSENVKKVPQEMKTDFLNWLAAQTGLRDFEISERLGQTFEDLFNEIELEYGRVAASEIDPRFVQLFLLERKKK